MGASLTNYQVRSNSSSAVCKALAPLAASRAYVSPPKDGWITVYDEDSDNQDQDALRKLAMSLSRKLDAAVFGFMVHHSDIAMYWLYQSGVLVDEFDSCPDYFGNTVDDATRARLIGNTDALLPLCIPGTTRDQVDAVIHPADGPPLMAEEILWDLGKLLGVDEARIGLGFEYFESEGDGTLPDIAEFEPVGKGAGRKTAKLSEPPGEPASAPPDSFCMAVGMLTQCWNPEHEKVTKTFGALLAEGSGDMFKQLRAEFDRGARDMLKRSNLPSRPTFEELRAARDQGPESLAELLAKRTPAQLAEVGFGAAMLGSEQFIAALLERGLNPSAANSHGRTPLDVARETHGQNSKVYQMLKSASSRRG